ncbi:MAG: Fic family protein [Solirubrobacteraceae bacterium]
MSTKTIPQLLPADPLGHTEKRLWPADPGAYGGRKARRPGAYELFIPDDISGRDFALDGAAVAAVSEATRALQHLEASPPRIATLGALAQNLLRSESVASSRIEGVHLSHKRLARAAYQAARGQRDPRAAEVLGNVEAMKHAIEIGTAGKPLTTSDIEDTHRTLLRFTEDTDIAGIVRESQNWIGGNDHNPIGAAYVPPPPEYVRPLLDDLCAFATRTDLAPIVQAGIAHAQFESIHPFADGNGRVGRALIYTVLRRRGEIPNYVPPISLILAAEPMGYVGGLTWYREGGVSAWIAQFADATARAATEAERLADEIEQLQSTWLDDLGQPRRDAAVRQLISALPQQPVIDVAVAQALTGKSHVAVGKALQELEHAGILQRLNERKWGRVWECDQLLNLVDAFENSVRVPHP